MEGGGRWVTSNIVGCGGGGGGGGGGGFTSNRVGGGGGGVSEFVPVFVDVINE